MFPDRRSKAGASAYTHLLTSFSLQRVQFSLDDVGSWVQPPRSPTTSTPPVENPTFFTQQERVVPSFINAISKPVDTSGHSIRSCQTRTYNIANCQQQYSSREAIGVRKTRTIVASQHTHHNKQPLFGQSSNDDDAQDVNKQ